MGLVNETREFSTRYYLRPTNGIFEIKKRDAEDNYIDIEPEDGKPINAVIGRLESFSIYHDNGTAPSKNKRGYDPYDALSIVLSDCETDELYIIKCNIERTFSWSFASKANDIAKGDTVKLTVTEGSKTGITFCDVQKLSGDNFVRVKQTSITGTPEEKAAIGREIIESHPAFRAPKE